MSKNHTSHAKIREAKRLKRNAQIDTFVPGSNRKYSTTTNKWWVGR